MATTEAFEELQLLDLQRCTSVDDIVRGMEHCSFGARMLGETAATLHKMIRSGNHPLLVYDGKPDTRLGRLLQEFVDKGWFTRVILPEEYAGEAHTPEHHVVVIGTYSERHEDALYAKPDRAVFINDVGMARPGQVKDGYFPDVVFGDPRFIMPVLYLSLQERLEGEPSSTENLLDTLSGYGGVASEIAGGAANLLTMVDDPDCFVFMTLSGAMTIAKMGLVVCDMIDGGMIHAMASTGALMAHGLVESIGLKHYKHNPKHEDHRLAALALNRVTDTLEPETNFDHVDEVVDHVLDELDGAGPVSPRIFHELLGDYLIRHFPAERGILKSAREKRVPVFVPAFTDSEIGNDLYVHNQKRVREGKQRIIMDMELDTEHLVELATGAKRLGIFTIGGGVPRNNIQNVAPLIEILNNRLHLNLPSGMFSYGTRICPDRMYYGHLSGCTYSEGTSWRKFDPNGRFAEIHADATQAWPFLAKYLMDHKSKPLNSR